MPETAAARCADHRPVLDSAAGWYCPACGSDAPPGTITTGETPTGIPARDPLAGLAAKAIRQTLHENAWVSLCIVRNPDAGVTGYVYSHESRCQGRIVAVLPYRDVYTGCGGIRHREYLVKSEMTPCWGFHQELSAITGGYEGGDIEDDAVRETLEETGYAITRDDLVPLGESFASKSADTVYTLFSADLTGRTAGEAIGDGTRLEAESIALWLGAAELARLKDPQIAVMYLRLELETLS